MIHRNRIADLPWLFITDALPQNVCISWLAESSKTGHLAFVVFCLEAAQVRYIGIKITERVKAIDAGDFTQLTVFADIHAPGATVAAPVERYDQSSIEIACV